MAFNVMDLLGYKNKPYVEGTWGPTGGFLGALNPFARDYAYSEAGREKVGKTPSAEVTTKYNNPKVYQNLIASGAPLPEGYNSTKTTNNLTNDLNNDLGYTKVDSSGDSSGGSSGGDGGSGGTGETEEEARQRFIQEQMDLARAKWEGGVKTARSKAENAKKYRDEMKGIIGNKRGEFENMFQEALGQIGVGASQRIGETGRMAQDMETAAGNRARALGLTGTTAMQMLNRPNDAHARDVFNISQQKTANENENRRLLGERQDWATGKESELDQYYQNIADETANLENMAYLNYWNDLSGLGGQIDSYLQSMINTQNQMALMNPQLTGYQASALTPSFQNTMASLQGLSNGLNTKQMPQETGEEPASLVTDNEYLKLLRNARA